MKPGTIEARRVLVTGPGATGVDFKVITLTSTHRISPVVTLMLEPFGVDRYTSATVSAVSTSSVTVRFSAPFRGYLHLHAVSEK